MIDIDGEKIVDHSGADSGAHALVFYLPQDQTGAVIFTNGENGQKVIREIVGIGLPRHLELKSTASPSRNQTTPLDKPDN